MLLCVQGLRVVDITMQPEIREIVVDVETRKRRHFCPLCSFATSARYDRASPRRWRHINLGVFQVWLEMAMSRLECPTHGVITEAVPWAEHGSYFTRDFEEMVTWMARQMPKTAIERLAQIAWRTVGTILSRTVDRLLDGKRFEELVEIGIDEVSYRKGHQYLSIIANHRGGDVVWASEGKSAETANGFFDQLGPEGCARIKAVTMDMSAAFINSVTDKCRNATIAFDPFHVVKLANAAVDEVRREEVRLRKGTPEGRTIKGTRWTLLKDADSHTDKDRLRLSEVAQVNNRLYRAYLFKEELRALYWIAKTRAAAHLDACLAWASRSRIPALVKLGRTLRKYRDGILAAVRLGLSNGRMEGINNKIGVLKHRSFGFHSAAALIALVYLCCAHVPVNLPW
jgi:transposase